MNYLVVKSTNEISKTSYYSKWQDIQNENRWFKKGKKRRYNSVYDFVGSFWPFLLLALLIIMAIVLRKKNTFFYWAARIVAILDIIFLAWDSFEIGGYELNNFFTHNILTSILLTSFPLLIILIIAWKYDFIGAIGFCLAGVFFLICFKWGDFPIGVVPIFIGILFAISWFSKRKNE